MTFGLLSLLLVYAVGTVVGFLFGAWWSREALFKAQRVYKAAKGAAYAAELILMEIERALAKDEARQKEE